MSQNKILVIGSSGNVGSELVNILKSQGHSVRSTTSKKEKSGGDTVYLDLLTGEGVADAFAGIERAFLLCPPGVADHGRVLFPLIDLAQKNHLKKVVLMSAMGADAVESAPLRQAELRLEKSGVPYNVIRPNWFMQNFHTFWIHGILHSDKIQLPVGTAKTSFIDTRDIAAVAARLLTDDTWNNQSFNLTGSEALDHDQVARAISEIVGRRITFQDITSDEMRVGLVGAGVPADYAEFLLVILGALKAGYASPVTGEVKRFLGRDPIPFQKYVQDHRSQWLK